MDLIEKTAETVQRFSNVLIGVKYHHAQAPLTLPLAREAADFAGGILTAEAYGVPIARDVQQRTGKKVTLGRLWVSLDQLAKRGLLKKRIADPTPQRGGRSKIYYSLTKEGVEALERVKEVEKTIWQNAPRLLKKAKGTL